MRLSISGEAFGLQASLLSNLHRKMSVALFFKSSGHS